jgi:hypothetical protein
MEMEKLMGTLSAKTDEILEYGVKKYIKSTWEKPLACIYKKIFKSCLKIANVRQTISWKQE